MADLADGEVVEVQGSAKKPYKVRNISGVYSCSCPAWRNQSAPTDMRTCKHIKKIRGAAAEEEREYVYDPSGKRDPFQPFIATQTPITPEGEKIPITPLQQYDLSQLKLVAIMVGKGEGRAMVEDAEGKGYIVEKGVYVGRNFGKVKAVMQDRLVIEERYKDYMGQVKTKEIVLQLHPPGEEEQP